MSASSRYVYDENVCNVDDIQQLKKICKYHNRAGVMGGQRSIFVALRCKHLYAWIYRYLLKLDLGVTLVIHRRKTVDSSEQYAPVSHFDDRVRVFKLCYEDLADMLAYYSVSCSDYRMPDAGYLAYQQAGFAAGSERKFGKNRQLVMDYAFKVVQIADFTGFKCASPFAVHMVNCTKWHFQQ